MPNPYVKNVAFIDNQLVLTVQVDDYPVGEVLEISGYATQNGGAFAVFNDVKAVPERNPDGTGYMYVKASPSQGFTKGRQVTVALRAARVWTTVLRPAQPEPGQASGADGAIQPPGDDVPADEGTTWNDLRAVTYAAPLSTGNAGQTPTGSGATFPYEA